MFYSDAAGFTSEKIKEDQVEITDSSWQKLIVGQSKGKIISSDKNGLPVLIDPPPLTKEQLTLIADTTKSGLMAEATNVIAPLEDAQKLGIATDAEIMSLKTWQTYRVLLYRVDTATAPDIEWPEKPV